MRVQKYPNGGVASKENKPDIKELLSVMDKMSSSPRTDRRATFKDGSLEEVHPSSTDNAVKGILHQRSAQDNSDQELNARGFLQKWMNSKKGMEMLKNSYANNNFYGDSWESAFVNRHKNAQNAHVSTVPGFNKMQFNPETNKLESAPDPNATFWRRGDQGNLGGSGHQAGSGGRPYIMGPQAIRNRGIVRIKSGSGPGTKIAVHELSHASDSNYDKSKSNRNIPKSDNELMINSSQDRDSGNYGDYVASPTETKARLQSVRSLMEDQGYDVFNEEITSNMLNKSYSNRDFGIKNESFYKELKKAYSDEEILKLLNTVS